MKRILILGRSGAGKSTLAARLGKQYDLPVFHLDKLFWLPGWVERSKADMALDVEKILKENEAWIIEGNYKKAGFESRVKAADIILVLDYGFMTCLWRVIKRNIIHWGKTRPDMQDDCVERLNLEFIKYIWSYPKRTLKPLEDVITLFPDKKVLKFKNQRELEKWVRGV